MLQILKKLLGHRLTKLVRPLGHGIKTIIAAVYFRFPARKLIKIGITGTKGKTTTTVYMGRLANTAGIRTGYFSTSIINSQPLTELYPHAIAHNKVNSELKGKKIDQKKQTTNFFECGEIENPYKMSSLDGWKLQKYLRTLVDAGCTHCVVELSSEGLAQNRHWGLGGLDVGILLNIFPEHIEAHGSFEKYVAAKRLLIQSIKPTGLFVAQTTTDHWKKIWKGTKHHQNNGELVTVTPQVDYTYQSSYAGIDVTYVSNNQSESIHVDSVADFDLENAMLAHISLKTLGIPTLLSHIPQILGVAGRMETAIENEEVHIIVDYAHEAESMKRLLTNLQSYKKMGLYSHIIHVVSCDGVGRDDWKKPVLGAISAQLADVTIATTDNYGKEDNPNQIIELLIKDIPESTVLFTDIDRKKAFRIALNQAYKHLHENKKSHKVVIVSTGVGNEFGLTQPEGTMEWNEKSIWEEVYNTYAIEKDTKNNKI